MRFPSLPVATGIAAALAGWAVAWRNALAIAALAGLLLAGALAWPQCGPVTGRRYFCPVLADEEDVQAMRRPIRRRGPPPGA